ncbi:hypothetical protein ACSQ67_008422 [Phaseolus vulgaris]
MTITFTTSLRLFFLLLHFSTHLQANYFPEDIFTISCGTTGNSSDGQRRWTGDEEYLSSQDGTVSEKATTQSFSINEIPYSTARLSRSQFNYSFPVSPGPKFLRLFFYPSDYPSFPRNQASFTLQSNQFTLLNAFNASLHADAQAADAQAADAQATKTIFREYVVNVNDGERYPHLHSLPSKLLRFHQWNRGFTQVGTTTRYSVETSSALQTEYRINSGADMDGKMSITVSPDYLAPKELFRTARNQGTNGTLNKMSNLTWVFPVDCGFTYVLRLHFCELDPLINDIGDRRFFIYINNQLAEDRADVLKWSEKQKGVAVHRNYAVMIPKNGNQKSFNLSLQMYPYESSVDTTYSDAFLNGLEIFKISEDQSNNLAGPNPDPVQSNSLAGPIPDPINNRRRMIGITAGVVSCVVFISLVVFFVLFSTTSKWTPLLFSTTKSTNDYNFSLPSDQCQEHHNNSKDNDKLMLELFSEIVDPKPR